MAVLCEECKDPAERHALVEAQVENPNGSFRPPNLKNCVLSQVRSLCAPCSISLKFTAGRSAAIKADGLKILLSVNPTFFAVNADLDPDIRTNAQIDSAF